ncbi:MAG: deaminase [Candidatus Pacebacteria bacterium CG_4_10_14_0_8_um_filter_42_14]|nr:MAG: deaminase [Candidatus Pacebacteria bacterium CG_4_10_14_0_8_um_filter_42_14]
MKITLAMVMSADGRTTKGDDPNIYSWTSPEDQEHFFSRIAENNLIIMGRKTYESAAEKIRFAPERLRVVMTKNPGLYAEFTVKGQLEFSNENPAELISRLEEKGFNRALLVGGETLNWHFLKAGLVDELLLTVEPQLFGSGAGLFSGPLDSLKLELLEQKQLNDQGTMLMRYKV